jgi:excisionase family DNA binding protein
MVWKSAGTTDGVTLECPASLARSPPVSFSARKITRRRRGRRSAREIVGQTLMHMRSEGLSLSEPHTQIAKSVAARNKRILDDRNWNEDTIARHVSKWLRENPDANDYRVALTLQEAARASGLKRALLYIAIGRGTLRAHKCGARALILQSDLQRFLTLFCKAPNLRR